MQQIPRKHHTYCSAWGGHACTCGLDLRRGDGAFLIATERDRQMGDEGYTPEHDDEHDGGQLAMAAACYASAAARERIYTQQEYAKSVRFADPFPWENDTRPHRGNTLDVDSVTDDDAIRLLVKAGALIAAEIDRITRKTK